MRKIKPGLIVKLTHGYYYENRDGSKRHERMPGLWLVKQVDGDAITVTELQDGPRGSYVYGKQTSVRIDGPTTRSTVIHSLVLRPYRCVVPRKGNRDRKDGAKVRVSGTAPKRTRKK